MIYMEAAMLLLLLALGIISSISDIKFGVIYNRVLLPFAVVGVILCGIYYIWFAKEYFFSFLINTGIVSFISLLLFFIHSFAGGDSKLLIVLSLLYPARCYLVYHDSRLTLLSAICFALLFSYVYLLICTIVNISRGRIRISKTYVKNNALHFLGTYIRILPYILLLNLVFRVISLKLIQVNSFVILFSCFALAFLVGKYDVLKKWYLVVPVLAIDVALSIYLKVIPISINPLNYLFVLIIMLLQMTMKTGIYEVICTSNVQEGMILSTESSLLMQKSRVRNLPAVSKEDLRNRLTATEAEAVKRWENSSTGLSEIKIVKKIPFAVFILLGYVIYFVLWRFVL